MRLVTLAKRCKLLAWPLVRRLTLNKQVNCWDTLRANKAETESERTDGIAKNLLDWAISSQAPFRRRFNDYPTGQRNSVNRSRASQEAGESPLNRSACPSVNEVMI